MITIKCTVPVCGKEFQFDEEKNPNAKKARCPYCKGIVDLTVAQVKTPDPIKEEVKAPPPPFSPISNKEENFNLQDKIYTPPPPVTNTSEPKEVPSTGINYKWLVIGGVGLVTASLILYSMFHKKPAIEVKPAYVMPAYKIKIDENQNEYNLNQKVMISGHIEPIIDSVSKIQMTLNNKLLSLSTDNHFRFDTIFTIKKDIKIHSFKIKLKCFKSDSLIRIDSQDVNITIVKSGKPIPHPTPVPDTKVSYLTLDLVSLAKRSTWFANNKNISTITGISENGYVNEDQAKKLEDESSKSGFTLCLGKARTALLYGVFEVNPAYYNSLSGKWGFHKIENDGSKNSKLQLEIVQYFEDGTFKKYNNSKSYDGNLSNIVFGIQESKKTIKFTIRLSKDVKEKSQPKILLTNY